MTVICNATPLINFAAINRLDIQLHWLEAAGFQNVDCWYKNFSFAVFGGYRPTI
ncbi:hypothetical protein [Nostoc sp.]|uniref:hypothetical protein n=1 Tax=Nostoc sp. TaxID=1180 RepID=UPI002FF89793